MKMQRFEGVNGKRKEKKEKKDTLLILKVGTLWKLLTIN